MIRVLVVEDSPTARALLVAILTSDPDVSVVGEARDGVEAVALTQKLRPDIVTMDIRMPRMDGFEATKEIMIVAPTPIVIVTASLLVHDIETSMCALRNGALAVLEKPPGPEAAQFEDIARELVAQVKSLSQVKVVRHWRRTDDKVTRGQGDKVTETAGDSPPHLVTLSPPHLVAPPRRAKIVAVATSTGGPGALQRLLADLPGDFPLPILVVQHITRGFVGGLTDWLNRGSDLHVRLARDGETLAPHTVYLAPDDHHLGVAAPGVVELSKAGPVGGFRPSGTFLFESVARLYGSATVALILTGMGDDGTRGLQMVRQAGGCILAQDEASSVVFGMPGAAIAAGLVDHVLPLTEFSTRLLEII